MEITKEQEITLLKEFIGEFKNVFENMSNLIDKYELELLTKEDFKKEVNLLIDKSDIFMDNSKFDPIEGYFYTSEE